ncbi:MAG: DUF3006 domain-containing protein [bacterium]
MSNTVAEQRNAHNPDEDPSKALTAVVDRVEQLQNGKEIAVLEFLDEKKMHVLGKYLPNLHPGAVYVIDFTERPEIEQKRREEISELQEDLIQGEHLED